MNNVVWLQLAVQSSDRAELDELRPGTGDKGVQKCVR